MKRLLVVILAGIVVNMLQAQQLSIGVEAGTVLSSFSKHELSSENINFSTDTDRWFNRGLRLSYYTEKDWVFSADYSNFDHDTDISSSFTIDNFTNTTIYGFTPLRNMFSLRIGKRIYDKKKKFSIIPYLGLGFTNIEKEQRNPFESRVMIMDQHTFENGLMTSVQTAINAGYDITRNHRISIQALLNMGTRYYDFYDFRIFDAVGEVGTLKLSNKADFLAMQVRYEYLFDLKKKWTK